MKRTLYKTKFEIQKDLPQTEVETTYNEPEPIETLKKDVEKKFSGINWLIYAIIIVLLIMVAGIIIDTVIFHIQENKSNHQIEKYLIEINKK